MARRSRSEGGDLVLLRGLGCCKRSCPGIRSQGEMVPSPKRWPGLVLGASILREPQPAPRRRPVGYGCLALPGDTKPEARAQHRLGST